MKRFIDPSECLSTHGGAGYAPGSYWEGDAIICGICGTKIDNPRPTGWRLVRSPGFLGIFEKPKFQMIWGNVAGQPATKSLLEDIYYRDPDGTKTEI